MTCRFGKMLGFSVISRSFFPPFPLGPNLNPAALARVQGPRAISSARVQPRAHLVPKAFSKIRTGGRELDTKRGGKRSTKRKISCRKWCTISAECGCPNARTTSYDHLSQEQVDLVCEFVTLEDRPIEHEIWDRIGGFYREVAAAIGRARQGAEEAARAPEAGEGAAAASWAPAAPSTAAASPRQQPKKKAAAPKLGIDVCPPGICIFLRGVTL